MTSSAEAAARIHAIEALQDDLLRQLEELERKSAAVLAAHLPKSDPVPDADAGNEPAAEAVAPEISVMDAAGPERSEAA